MGACTSFQDLIVWQKSHAYKGEAEIMEESFVFLVFALVLGIIIAYMVLASQFENFIHPFTILLSMSLSFIGAFGWLFITGKTINIFSLIGASSSWDW